MAHVLDRLELLSFNQQALEAACLILQALAVNCCLKHFMKRKTNHLFIDSLLLSYSTAHPVTFVNSPEEECFKSIVEQDQLVLACEVSRADAPVQWYMDGVEIQASDNVAMRADDTMRILTIRSARLSDTGTYTCRAGDSALIFKVNIRGNVWGKRPANQTQWILLFFFFL